MKSKLPPSRASIIVLCLLVIIFQPFVSWAQEGASIVKGIVHGENNQPIIGASVVIKNSQTNFTTGAKTDSLGFFTVSVPPGGPYGFTISGIGYDSQILTGYNLKGGTIFTLDVSMKAAAGSLEQVVVVGYGRQKRTYITGAVSSANLDVVRDAPNTNIIQSLQGNVPGLNVGPVTSAGSTPSITIRGRNTINGNQNVLIILDGIQYNSSLSSINPDDIASIDVLKDASATAVYGAQAANGVLLITSRRGVSGAKARINFSSSYATQTPAENIRPLNKEQYLNKVRDLHWNLAYLGPDYTQPNPAFDVRNYVDVSMRNPRSLDSTDFNWYDAGTKQGFINDNQLSVSGASDKFNYLLSGAYTNQAGYIINDHFKRITLRVNLESQATDWLKIGVQSFGSFVNADGAEPDLGALFQMSPLQTPYKADGSLNPFPFNSVDPNPFLTYDISDRERHNYLFANVFGEVNIPFVKGLTYRVNFGNNYRTDQRFYASKYAGGQTGQAYKYNESYYDYTLDNILTYSRTFKKHNILATAVYGASQRKNESSQATGTGFTSLTLGYDNLALATTREITSDGYQESLNYYMGRLNYAFDGKYLLTATIRRDGFSAFAENHKWGTFPSVSIGWILTEEPFMKKLNFINNLKLTAGYGVAGNQTQRYFSLDRLTSQAAYVFGDGGSTVFGQNISTLANPDLKWEKTKELNIGLDFSVLNSRLSGRFDFYKRNTNDLLFSVNIPTITGFTTINTNVGEVQNTGFEVSLNSKNIDNKNFRWNTTFNFSRNVNKVVELLGSGDLVASNLFIGQPIGAIYGYTTNGIYQINDQIPAGYYAGSYRIVDISKNGTAGPEDRSILGSSDPAYRFSFLNSLAYKGFTFTFLVNSIQGGDNGYLAGNSPSLSRSDVSIRNGGIAGIQYWTPANPNSPYVLFTQGAPTINPTIYYSRSFVRLQDITLSYNFGNYLKKMNIQNLSLFVSGKNLKTWTKWKGWDPETGGGLFAARPLLKGYSVGLNVTF